MDCITTLSVTDRMRFSIVKKIAINQNPCVENDLQTYPDLFDDCHGVDDRILLDPSKKQEKNGMKASITK